MSFIGDKDNIDSPEDIHCFMTWSRCPKNDRCHKPTTGVPASGHMVEVSRRLWREEMRARCRGVEEDEEERLAMRKNLKLEQLHQAVSSSAWNWLNRQPKLPYWSTPPPPSSCPQGQSFPPSPLPLPPSALGKLTPLVSSSAPLSWSPWNRPPWWWARGKLHEPKTSSLYSLPRCLTVHCSGISTRHHVRNSCPPPRATCHQEGSCWKAAFQGWLFVSAVWVRWRKFWGLPR